MAFRRPLYYNGSGQLQEMNDTMISEIRRAMFWEFVYQPSVYLEVWYGGGGNLGTYVDTRLTAGAYKTGVSDYPAETSTDEPGVKTVQYSRFNQQIIGTGATDVNNLSYPAYFDGGNQIRAMNLQDMLDTFAYSTAYSLAQPDALYTIAAGTTYINGEWSYLDNVFSDTRADTAAYTAEGIEEVYDQPTTINNYYLFRRNVRTDLLYAYTQPVLINTSGNLYSITQGSFNSTLREVIRFTCAYVAGSRLRFGINYGTWISGTGMSDTRLDGSGAYTQRFVGGDDYRAQEFPNGTAQTLSTYYLYSRLE